MSTLDSFSLQAHFTSEAAIREAARRLLVNLPWLNLEYYGIADPMPVKPSNRLNRDEGFEAFIQEQCPPLDSWSKDRSCFLSTSKIIDTPLAKPAIQGVKLSYHIDTPRKGEIRLPSPAEGDALIAELAAAGVAFVRCGLDKEFQRRHMVAIQGEDFSTERYQVQITPDHLSGIYWRTLIHLDATGTTREELKGIAHYTDFDRFPGYALIAMPGELTQWQDYQDEIDAFVAQENRFLDIEGLRAMVPSDRSWSYQEYRAFEDKYLD